MTGWHVTGPPGSKAPAGGVQSLSGLSASAAVADGGLVLPAAADLDPALLLLRFGRLGQRHAQHAVLEGRLHLVGIDREGQADRAGKAAVGPLHHMVVLLLVLVRYLLFTPDRQNVIAQGDLDIVLVNARQLGDDLQVLVGFADINARHRHAGCDRLGASSTFRQTKAPKGFIEQAVHLAMQSKEWITAVPRGRRGETAECGWKQGSTLHGNPPVPTADLTGLITMYVRGLEMNTVQMGEINWIGSAPDRQRSAFRHDGRCWTDSLRSTLRQP